jgi:hypothetical protein
MNLSEQVINMIDETELSEQSDLTNDEKVVEFLELIGIQEGIDFCFYEGEFCISEEVGLPPTDKSLDMTKFPIVVKIATAGNDKLVNYLDKESIEKSVVLPLSVYNMLLYHSE